MALSPVPSSRTILIPLIAIILGTFMVILDNTVVNVALPTLGRVLNSDLSLLQWVITGYMLAQAAVIPLSGWLSDRFGAKRIYLLSLVLFTAGSALYGPALFGPYGQVLLSTTWPLLSPLPHDESAAAAASAAPRSRGRARIRMGR